MKNLFYKIKSHFPSKQGLEALNDLRTILSQGGIEIQVEEYDDQDGKHLVARSTNLDNKEIITSGRSLEELDHNIKDAIFTAFHVPTHYCNFDLIRTSLPVKNTILKYATA